MAYKKKQCHKTTYSQPTESSIAYCVGMFMVILKDMGMSREQVVAMLSANTLHKAYSIANHQESGEKK